MSCKHNQAVPETVAQHQRLHWAPRGPWAARRGSRWSDAKNIHNLNLADLHKWLDSTQWTCTWRTSQRWSHHVYSLVNDNVLDLAHLYKPGGFSTWGVAGRHLNAQGADDEQRLVVNLHKVDVEHHANQGDDDGCWQDGCVLQGRGDMHRDRFFPGRQCANKGTTLLTLKTLLAYSSMY